MFSGLPIFAVKDGIEYRVIYSVSEIAYRAWRTSDNTTVLQWQDPEYYDNPVKVYNPVICEKLGIEIPEGYTAIAEE